VEDLDLDAELLRVAPDPLVVLGQRHGAEDVQLDLAAHVHAGAVDHQNLGHGGGPQPSSAATASISMSASGIARFPICTSVLAGGLGPEKPERTPPHGPRSHPA